MQLADPGVFGPLQDRGAAIAVLREVVELGITHIDTSDFYGPHVTNQIIREALHPYPDELRVVTKVRLPDVQPGDRPPDKHPLYLAGALEDREDIGIRSSFHRSAACTTP
jgi:pyridoxine 4-dehydrogenase